MEKGKKFQTVAEYFSEFPQNTQSVMEAIRLAIKEAAPQAEELISYNMPAFKLHGMLVYYAAYQNHIGFYPTPSGIKAFEQELTSYQGAKGSVQFPINQPVPLDLIREIVKFRVKENESKAKGKAAGR